MRRQYSQYRLRTKSKSPSRCLFTFYFLVPFHIFFFAIQRPDHHENQNARRFSINNSNSPFPQASTDKKTAEEGVQRQARRIDFYKHYQRVWGDSPTLGHRRSRREAVVYSCFQERTPFGVVIELKTLRRVRKSRFLTHKGVCLIYSKCL